MLWVLVLVSQDRPILKTGDSEVNESRFRMLSVDRCTDALAHGTEAIILGTKALVPGTEAIIPGTKALVPGTEAIIPGTDALVPGTEAIIPGTDAIIPGTKALVPGTEAIIPGTDALVPGTNALVNGMDALIPGTHALFTLSPISLTRFMPLFLCMAFWNSVSARGFGQILTLPFVILGIKFLGTLSNP